MINSRLELTEGEVAVYELLMLTRTFSHCIDKQVAACSVQQGMIVGLTFNKINSTCNLKCNGSCKPQHAEQQLINLSNTEVYISLFPCEECQRYLHSKGVNHIYVFAPPHKKYLGLTSMTILPDIASLLYTFNGSDRQKQVVCGEMAELTIELLNSMRKDTRSTDIEGEYVDVTLQMHCLEKFNQFSLSSRVEKYNKLIKKFSVLLGVRDGV